MARKLGSAVRVTVLGCAGSKYDEVLRLPCSSYLIESDSAALLLDCGFGSYESFLELSPNTLLDGIFVSHAHGDHAADIELFLDTTTVWRHQPRLIASKQTVESIVQFEDDHHERDLIFASDDTGLELLNFKAEFSLTTHQMPTLAVCVSMSGCRVAYCADTGPTWSIPSNFTRSDLAIVECTLERRDDRGSGFHLDAREAGYLAGELLGIQTLITHVPPGQSGDTRLEIASSYSPNQTFLLAHTGDEIALSSWRTNQM
jgi:ribonuclease BN (tRNA processing enzyme)